MCMQNSGTPKYFLAFYNKLKCITVVDLLGKLINLYNYFIEKPLIGFIK